MTHAEVPADTPGAERPSRWFWGGLVAGWLVIGYGIWGVFDNASRTTPLRLAGYVIGFAVLHDAVIVPLAVVIGWLAARWLPPLARGPVRGALALSAILAVFAYPLVRRLGARSTNSSALPLDYTRNLLIVLALVWLATAVIVAVRLRRRRRPAAS